LALFGVEESNLGGDPLQNDSPDHFTLNRSR
jgi:hypothetical protein